MGPIGRIPPTLENLGTMCIWSPPAFVTVIFVWLDTLLMDQNLDIQCTKNH